MNHFLATLFSGVMRSVLWAMLLICGVGAAAQTPVKTSDARLDAAAVNILPWARMSAPDFGCFMEKTLGYRDAKFNCALKNYKNHGGPCRNTKAYYEGPKFPQRLASRVHPLATYIGLDWEHGNLRQITVNLKGMFSEQEVRDAFKVPKEFTYRDNVMSVDVQNCSTGMTCLNITGFDHIGSGDVDCP